MAVKPFQGRYIAASLWVILIASDSLYAAEAEKFPTNISSEICSDCHQEEGREWSGSHHAWAWRDPTPDNVLGDFRDTEFRHQGNVTRFKTREGRFQIETQGADGKRRSFDVKGTVGVAPLQQYLLEPEPGRLQALDIAWDIKGRRWYHLFPKQDSRPGNGEHWTGPYKNWNGRCAECHAVGFKKNYDPLTRLYSSVKAEKGVGCEGCHGPGSAHVAWAQDRQGFDPTKWRGVDKIGFTIAFDRKNATTEVRQCAGCHSRREAFGDGNPRPGTPFTDSYRLALLRDGLYHADGQIRDEVYVYGSFLQSKMSRRGVRCTDCHNPHSGALKARGNEVCTQCHNPAGNSRFGTLKKTDYDTPKHHFHKPGSNGAQCKSCHMLERTYMGIDGRRDHSFRAPRPDLSAELGTPNACSDCHKDKSPGWAAVQLANRFPASTHRSDHYATAFTAARAGKGGAETATSLIKIALSNREAGIVRATALSLLRRYLSPGIANQTAELLRDPDPLIRAAAAALQRAAPLAIRVHRMDPLFADKRKAVRIKAARSILDLLAARASPTLDKSARRAVGEYRSSMAAKADFPEIQMAIAGTALAFRNFRVADRAFYEAVTMDPQRVDAWMMIARIRAAQGNPKGAVDALLEGIVANPNDQNLNKFLRVIRRPNRTR